MKTLISLFIYFGPRDFCDSISQKNSSSHNLFDKANDEYELEFSGSPMCKNLPCIGKNGNCNPFCYFLKFFFGGLLSAQVLHYLDVGRLKPSASLHFDMLRLASVLSFFADLIKGNMN